jgi:hypothetical protein
VCIHFLGGTSVFSYKDFCHFRVPCVMYNFGFGIWQSPSKHDATIPQNLKSHMIHIDAKRSLVHRKALHHFQFCLKTKITTSINYIRVGKFKNAGRIIHRGLLVGLKVSMEYIIVNLAIYRAGFNVMGVLGQPECGSPY